MNGCMILAAGFGTRMGALTADRPKPLIKVAGRALVDHALEQARVAGVAPIVVNGHYRADQVRAHLADHPDVTFSEERPEILDSAGGIRAALPVLGAGPIATLNADAVWAGPPALRHLARHWVAEEMDALLLMVPQARAVGRKAAGDFAIDAAGRLDWDKAGDVYTGAQILGPALLAAIPPGASSLHAAWNDALARGRLYGCLYPGFWADVGHPEGIAEAEAMLQEHGHV